MNYEQAMLEAETTGTSRRNKRRKAYRTATWSVGWVLLIGLLIWLPSGPLQTYARWSEKERETPSVAASQGAGQADVPLVRTVHSLPAVPANGDSEHILPPVGHATDFGGPAGFTIHCVYRGQSGGIGEDRTAPCPDGDMVYVYLHNDTTNVLEGITYEFVRPVQ